MPPLRQVARITTGFTSGLPSRSFSSQTSASAIKLQDARPPWEIPGPKGKYNIPGIGPLFHFKPFTDVGFEEPTKLLDNLLNTYGPLVRVRLGGWKVLVQDPADIEVIYKNEGKYPNRMHSHVNELFALEKNLPMSLGTRSGEDWHNARSPLNALMMRTKSAQYYLPVQNEVADDLVEHLKKPISPVELNDLFYRYACESISVMCFNKRLGYLDTDEDNQAAKLKTLDDINVILDETVNSFKVPKFILKYFPHKTKKRYFESAERVVRKTTEYYESAVKEIEQKRREGTLNVDKHDFMLSLMSSGKIEPEMMASIAFSLFVAGTDSTARSTQVILYHLARNPDKQEKLYQEVLSTMGSSGPLTVEALVSMTYLPMCLRESFRMSYPTLTGIQRIMPVDTVLSGYKVPAGTTVWLMNQRLIKDTKYFPNPESFHPERWLRDEDRKRPTDIPAAVYRPFGFGKRMCIGKRFAEQEIYLAVTKILQKYKVSLANDKELELSYTPFGGPKTPLEFIFEERRN